METIKETLTEKFKDILLEYDSDEITNKTAVEHLEKTTLDFAADFAHWIRYDVKDELNFSIDSLLGQYQAHLSLTKTKLEKL